MRQTGDIADRFAVSYQKGELVVEVRGAHYGHGVDLSLGWGKRRSVGFGHLLTLRDPNENHEVWKVRGQSGQLRAYAVALRACAADILNGDLSFLPVVYEHQMRLYREYQREEARKYRNYRRRLRRAERKAAKADQQFNPCNPPRRMKIDAAWLAWHDRTVPKIAQSIHDTSDFNLMPLLADALEDAGCTNTEVLAHCRSPGEHVQTCWVLDLVLGK